MILNEKIPGFLLGKYQLIGTVTFSVLFALVFLNIYIPFSDTAWFGLGDSIMFLLTLVFGAVSIFILILSRILMYRSKRSFDMTYLGYVLWCILEIVAICGFYTWLTVDITAPHSESVGKIFGRSLLYGTIALGVPYVIAGMYFAIIDKNNTIRLMNFGNIVTEDTEPFEGAGVSVASGATQVSPDTVSDNPGKDSESAVQQMTSRQTDPAMQKITLFDNNGSLKLSLSPENLFYIESDDNYIKVWYTDSKGELKQYMLRCRLKTVEESFKDSGLIRCNRKYIVNIKKVRMLRKESDGYVLDIDNESIPPIPVTKTYTDSVLSYFTEQSPLLEPME